MSMLDRNATWALFRESTAIESHRAANGGAQYVNGVLLTLPKFDQFHCPFRFDP